MTGALAGALLVAGILLGLAQLTGRLPTRDSAAPRRRRRTNRVTAWLQHPDPQVRRRRRIHAGVAAATGPLAWLVSGIPIMVLIAPAAVLTLPWLFRTNGSKDYIAHVNAIGDWTQLIQGLLTANRSIEQAIMASVASAPPPIAPAVTRLARRLQSGRGSTQSLLDFADDLDEQLGDMVVLTLISGVERRGPGAAQTLGGLADTIADRVRARRAIEAEYGKSQGQARLISVISGVVILYSALLSPSRAVFSTPLGQIILLFGLGMFVVAMLLLKRMMRVVRPGRIIGGSPTPPGAIELDRSREPLAVLRLGRPRPGVPASAVAPVVLAASPASVFHSQLDASLATALLAGALLGAGLFLLARAVLPRHPDLASAIGTVHGRRRINPLPDDVGRFDIRVRGGQYLLRRIGDTTLLGRARTEDRAIISLGDADYYGLRLTWALLGALLAPTVAFLYGTLVGGGTATLLSAIPVVAVLGAIAGWVLFDRDVRNRAGRARADAAAAVVIFLDLVAIDRVAGGGTGNALTNAASTANSWIFLRMRDAMGRATLDGRTAWDALDKLGRDLDIVQLGDVADIVRLAGSHGASITSSLQARARAMRSAQENAELQAANRRSPRLILPLGLLVLTLVVVVLVPFVASFATSTPV